MHNFNFFDYKYSVLTFIFAVLSATGDFPFSFSHVFPPLSRCGRLLISTYFVGVYRQECSDDTFLLVTAALANLTFMEPRCTYTTILLRLLLS